MKKNMFYSLNILNVTYPTNHESQTNLTKMILGLVSSTSFHDFSHCLSGKSKMRNSALKL